MSKKIYFLIIISIFLVSCSNGINSTNIVSQNIDPTKVVLDKGDGGIMGELIIPPFWDGEQIYAYAAPYLGDPEGEGIFILDDKVNKYAKVEADNYFQIANIDPGIYILVVGPDTDSAKAYRRNGIAVKITITSDEFTDVGKLYIEN